MAVLRLSSPLSRIPTSKARGGREGESMTAERVSKEKTRGNKLSSLCRLNWFSDSSERLTTLKNTERAGYYLIHIGILWLLRVSDLK